MTKVAITWISLIFLLFKSQFSFGFELNTHAVLSERSVAASTLNDFLIGVLSLDFPSGINEQLKVGQFGRVRDLISEIGSKNEDKPAIRSRFHFHDPTQPWSNAGLRWPLVGQVGQSSALWGQNTNQEPGGKHSWQDARNSYFSALTGTNEVERKRYFAETFESLGHLIHLVQDVATPSHTRNDTHISFDLQSVGYTLTIGDPDRFHQWANNPTVIASVGSQSQGFDPSILSLTPNSFAPIPIARIVDTEVYRTSGVPATPTALDNIGIAEFSNANFFSDDTIFSGYAYPAATSMDLTAEPVSPNGPFRFYLRKNRGPGAIGYRTAVASRLFGFVPLGFGPQQWDLDDNVMADYGAMLFPRAIGYSAGLIDYFFRGRLDLSSLGIFFDANGLVTRMVVGWQNNTEEDSGTGELTIVIPYQQGNEVRYARATRPIELTAEFQLAEFDFSNEPWPFDWSFHECRDTVRGVFRGPFGNEEGAVVTGATSIGCG